MQCNDTSLDNTGKQLFTLQGRSTKSSRTINMKCRALCVQSGHLSLSANHVLFSIQRNVHGDSVLVDLLPTNILPMC